MQLANPSPGSRHLNQSGTVLSKCFLMVSYRGAGVRGSSGGGLWAAEPE